MGIVEEVGCGVTNVTKGDRVVVPFGIACGACFMCRRGLQSQCETTQVREEEKGAALLGYTRLYGSLPGGHAEYPPRTRTQDGTPGNQLAPGHDRRRGNDVSASGLANGITKKMRPR